MFLIWENFSWMGRERVHSKNVVSFTTYYDSTVGVETTVGPTMLGEVRKRPEGRRRDPLYQCNFD